MLKNDLSNKSVPKLLFSFDNIICEEIKVNLLGSKYVLDRQNINTINNLYRKDFTIIYVTFKWPTRKIDSLEEELDEEGCLYNGVIKSQDTYSLRAYMKKQNQAMYFDKDHAVVDYLGVYATKWEEWYKQLWNKG